MNALTQVLAERSSHAERNDCSVVALSIVVGIPYDYAHHKANGHKYGLSR